MSFLNLTLAHLVRCLPCLAVVALSAFSAACGEPASTGVSSSDLEQSPKACVRGVELEDDWANGVPQSYLFEDLKNATGGVTTISGVVSAQDRAHLHFPTPATARLEAFSEITQGADGATEVTVSGFGDAGDRASVVARGLFEAMTHAHQDNAGARVVRSSSWGYYICEKTTDNLGVRYSCTVGTTGHVSPDECP